MEPLCLRCAVQHVPTVLGPFERKGFELVGLKTRGGGALIALRGPADAIAAGRELVAALLASELPAGATVLASASLTEALDWMHDVLGGPREVVQWQDPDEAGYWLRAEGDLAPSGAHNDNRECFRLADLMHAPGEDGGGAGARFCAQLRRDSYVPILVPAEQRALLEAVESGAAQWFALPEDDKYEQGGAYGHVDRKFTGYRAGKFREQLEVRQTIGHTHGGLYPMPTAPPPFGEELRSLIYFLDGTARSLLRHIAVDVGADDGFFESLLDAPPPPLPTGAKAKAKAEAKAKAKAKAKAQADVDAEAEADAEADAPPALGHSLIRLCRYDAESEGVGGGNVLCEEHNDVGFITLDACASTAGLEVYRRADAIWVAVEEAPLPPSAKPDDIVVMAMVGDTLGRLTANYYAPCKHRVVAPASGERIGLPFLFRGRSDAVLNTLPTREKCAAAGREVHLAEMETTTIKELPAFDSARAILRNWRRNFK